MNVNTVAEPRHVGCDQFWKVVKFYLVWERTADAGWLSPIWDRGRRDTFWSYAAQNSDHVASLCFRTLGHSTELRKMDKNCSNSTYMYVAKRKHKDTAIKFILVPVQFLERGVCKIKSCPSSGTWYRIVYTVPIEVNSDLTLLWLQTRSEPVTKHKGPMAGFFFVTT